MRRQSLFIVIFAALFSLAGILFIFPQLMGSKIRPWRLGLDLIGGSRLVYRVDLSQVDPSDRESVLGGLRDVIERRVNIFGVTEPRVYIAKTAGEASLIVELAGVDIKEAVAEIGATPLLDFREVREKELDKNDLSGEEENFEFVLTELTGRYVKGAKINFDPATQKPEVLIDFNREGSKIFEELTEKNVGKPLGIFLDNILISAPIVKQKISGGSAVITGNFSLEEAKRLVERFNAGALPAPITLIDERTVSASLGLDSLRKGIIAGIAGGILVALFMIIFYGFLGIFAVLALIIYVIFTLSLFKAIPVTLTLAGLAGFILTIGMAVDANILIFERTKEELKKGLSRKAAIEEGFRRAWPSIRDSNITTILSAIILFYFTSSFIRGFALTLLLGTLISMLSAIVITRSFLRVFYKERVIKS